ncbi:outer membrane porin [Pandoraea eparura]|uniref:Outer membrane porin n=1 Tax=Pandoraea eparura TaxID=2508291 RepID=A0A5E4RFU4_9BURK|nr:porin [Pandoraea eparura]VVD61392.1 outer membrane porin [Pandoraea eparura]
MMKAHKLVAWGGVCLLALTGYPCAAQESLQIYGVLQAAYEQYHISGADASSAVASPATSTSRIPSYGSFIGFRGRESIDGDLAATFQIESYVFLNGVQPPGFNPFGSRNTRVGLESQRYGTVFLGVWDTPFRDLLIRLPFPGSTLDAGQLMGNGIGNTVGNGPAPGSFERRQTNTVAYWSPTLHGFQARVHYGINDGTTGGNGAHLLSMRGSYAGGPFNLMAAYETHHDYGGFGTNDRGLALYGDWLIGHAKLGAIFTQLSYQRVVNGGQRGLRVNNWSVFGSYPVGSGAVNVAYTRAGSGSGSLQALSTTPTGQVQANPALYAGQATSGGQTGAQMFEIGYDYYVSKRTKLFANLAYLKNDAHGAYAPFGAVPTPTGALGLNTTVLALGMVTSF